MENNEIMTSEIELAEIETTENTMDESESGFDFGKATVIALGLGALTALAVKVGKKVCEKVKPMITASRIKKLEKEGYLVYLANDDACEDADFVTESEVVEDESEE